MYDGELLIHHGGLIMIQNIHIGINGVIDIIKIFFQLICVLLSSIMIFYHLPQRVIARKNTAVRQANPAGARSAVRTQAG